VSSVAALDEVVANLRLLKRRAQQPGGPRIFFDALGEELQDWQEEGLEAVMDVRRFAAKRKTSCFNRKGLPRISVRSCHGTGKTQWLAQAIHLWNFTTYGLVACTAPKQDQLKTRLWARYRAIRRNAPEWYREMIQVDALRIKVLGDEDWGAVAETASEPENLAGYHDKPQLFLVDEASGQRLDAMFPVIEGALTTPGSVVAEIGNPTRSSGEFWAHHNKRGTMELYYRMHVKPEDAAKYVSRAWVDAMAKKYGVTSPIYRVRVLGEFVEQEANQLVNYGWLSEAREREFAEDGSVPRLVVSVDVAAGGEDFTVCEASRFYVTNTRKLRQEKHNFDPRVASLKTAEAAVELFERFGGTKEGGPSGQDFIVVDMIGVGNGAYNYLVQWGYPVVGYSGGSASDDLKRWRNRRVQSYWAFHDDLQAGRVSYAEDFVDGEEDWDEYCDQVCAIRSRPGEERVEDLEPKDMLIKRTHKSPDRADTSAMAYVTELPDVAASGSTTVQAFGGMLSAQQNW